MLVSSSFDVLSLTENADYWRNRAEKAREMAASMNEQNSRQTIIGVADA